jgi:hypothetical protein
MRQEEDRRDAVAAFEAEEHRRKLLEKIEQPKEPEGVTPEQMELIRDARTKIYWIYKTKNIKELEVEKIKGALSFLKTGPLHAFSYFFKSIIAFIKTIEFKVFISKYSSA